MGFVHLYIFTVIVSVLNNAYCKVCTTGKVLYLACNLALVKCFVFQQLVVLIVRVTCCKWHNSWSHVQGIPWCAIDWLVFVTEVECVYCAVRTEALNMTLVNPSLYPRIVQLCIRFRHRWPSCSFLQFPQLCSRLPVQYLDCLPMSSSGTRIFWSTCLSGMSVHVAWCCERWGTSRDAV